MREINICGRRVGPAHPPLVVAEIGINHNGSLELARTFVDAAAEAGVEVVKHQTHVVSDEMSGAARHVIPGNAEESIYDIMDVGACKIGSGECNNYPLLEHIAAFGKPIILSTGMNGIDSVAKSVEIFERNGVPYALLHTTNLYPTPPHLVRLGAMVQLAEAFPRAVVGLSDHTTNNLACFGAVALGASILERHFTDTMNREGPDIVCSMDVQRCRELIDGSRILHQEIGGTKGPLPEERVTMDFAFATVVTIADVRAGDVFTKANLWVKRPGTGGISAERYKELLGKKAVRDLPMDTHLQVEDVAQPGG